MTVPGARPARASQSQRRTIIILNNGLPAESNIQETAWRLRSDVLGVGFARNNSAHCAVDYSKFQNDKKVDMYGTSGGIRFMQNARERTGSGGSSDQID